MINKIKFIGFISSLITLLVFFATQALAMTCNSATLNGTITVANPPVNAWFEYSNNYNTLTSGQGISTNKQIFNSDGAITQPISGLTESTTYYFRVMISDASGITPLNTLNFTTPACTVTPPPVQPPTPPTYPPYYPPSYPPYYPPTYTPTYSPNYNPYYNQTPIVNLNANETYVTYGSSTYINWSTQNNPYYCFGSRGSNGWSTQNGTSGNFYTGPLYTNTTYIMNCSNNTGSGYGTVTINISNPNIYPIYPSFTPVNPIINPIQNTIPTIKGNTRAERIVPAVNTTPTVVQPATNVSRENTEELTSPLGANAFGAGFLPKNTFEWVLLVALALVLGLLAKHAVVQTISGKK